MAGRISITLRLSGGLRAILSHLPAVMEIGLPGPAPVTDILLRAGINPLAVIMVAREGCKITPETVVDGPATLDVIGPAAGG